MTRISLSAIALCVFAALGMSSMQASATTTGHFVSDKHTTILDITDSTSTEDRLKLSFHGMTIECHHPTYAVHFSGTTTQEITLTTVFNNCTKNSDSSSASVTMNACHFVLTSRTPPAHGTVHFKCPEGAKAEVHTNAGTAKFGEQTPTGGGIVYNAIIANNKHAVTADVTVTGIHVECHGFCAFVGTKRTDATLTGSVIVEGTNASNPGEYSHFTAT